MVTREPNKGESFIYLSVFIKEILYVRHCARSLGHHHEHRKHLPSSERICSIMRDRQQAKSGIEHRGRAGCPVTMGRAAGSDSRGWREYRSGESDFWAVP